MKPQRTEELIRENIALRDKLSEDHPDADFMADCLNFSLGTLKNLKREPRFQLEQIADLEPDEFQAMTEQLRSYGYPHYNQWADRMEEFRNDNQPQPGAF